ncbi:MAG: glycine cleavage system protein GcvH [Chloroflexi bacterium]|nr:MAG: glycine cleavage system protein GcvH [Chloroflexota bacterium]
MGDWTILDTLKYTESDEWVKVEGDTAKIGLTDYAQDQLSDIVFVDLSEVEVGSSLTRGDTCAAVESVKAASDVYAPVSGKVTAINGALEDEPEAINKDPYGAGWLVEVRIANPSELDGLMDAAAYKKHCDARE